jgi:hypothetical protein
MVRSDMKALVPLFNCCGKIGAIQYLDEVWLNPLLAASKMRRRMNVTTPERWQSG